MPAEEPQRQVALAEVARPHGVRGELRLKVYNLDSEQLWEHAEVRVVPPAGEPRTMVVVALRRTPDAVLMRLEGVDDREAAEALRGAAIEVPRDALGALDQDEFYICDLELCDAWLAGERLGRVRAVVEYPTCHVLVIERDGGGEGPRRIEVPLHADYVDAIDVDARRIDLARVDDLT